MAARMTMLQFLQADIGLSNQAALSIMDDHGLDSLDALQEFTQEEMKTLVQATRRPGGTVPNPQAGVAGQPDLIPNLGFRIPATCENRLYVAVFIAKHLARTSRQSDRARFSRAELTLYRQVMTTEKDREEPDEPTPPTKNQDMQRWFETLDSYLLVVYGVQGVPLAYVVRDDPEMPRGLDPPASYDTIQLEMIRRCPHGTVLYQQDNRKVWSILANALTNHLMYVNIRRFARTQDGRSAYLALRQNVYGQSRIENILSKAEGDLESTFYTDEKPSFNFDTYVSIHRNAYNDMVQAPNYAAPDDPTRVRKLLANIRSSNPKVIAAVASVQASPILRADFEQAVDTVSQSVRLVAQTKKRNLRISAVGQQGGGGGKGKKRGNRGGNNNNNDVQVEDRYYTMKEYRKLKPQQKRKLKELRDKREGGQGGGAKRQRTDDRQVQVVTLEMAQQMIAAATINDDDDNGGTNATANGNGNGNGNNNNNNNGNRNGGNNNSNGATRNGILRN